MNLLEKEVARLPAYVQDIYIEQGASFPYGFVLHDPELDVDGNVVLDDDGAPVPGDARDLTGCTVRMQIRPSAKSSTLYVSASSESLDDDPEGGGRITIEAGAETGRIDIVLTDQDTMAVTKEEAFYDVELVHPLQLGEVRRFVERILQGAVTNDLNVTRDAEDDA